MRPRTGVVAGEGHPEGLDPGQDVSKHALTERLPVRVRTRNRLDEGGEVIERGGHAGGDRGAGERGDLRDVGAGRDGESELPEVAAFMILLLEPLRVEVEARADDDGQVGVGHKLIDHVGHGPAQEQPGAGVVEQDVVGKAQETAVDGPCL